MNHKNRYSLKKFSKFSKLIYCFFFLIIFASFSFSNVSAVRADYVGVVIGNEYKFEKSWESAEFGNITQTYEIKIDAIGDEIVGQTRVNFTVSESGDLRTTEYAEFVLISSDLDDYPANISGAPEFFINRNASKSYNEDTIKYDDLGVLSSAVYTLLNTTYTLVRIENKVPGYPFDSLIFLIFPSLAVIIVNVVGNMKKHGKMER